MRVWSILKTYTILVYAFMFAPILVVLVLAFNSSQFGGFPIEGLSFRWFVKLYENEAIVRAFRTSLLLGSLTAVISTTLGILAALALVRYEFRGKDLITTFLIAPVLVPETVLAVGLLIFLRWVHMPRSFGLLLLGHSIIALPFVVLVVQARLVGIRRDYEEAAQSLGASPLQTFFAVTFPLMLPAVFAGALFAFTISFDNITATVFWRPAGMETVPTQIFGMLRNSVSPEINALGFVMICITVGVPLLAGALARYFSRKKNLTEVQQGVKQMKKIDSTKRYEVLRERMGNGDIDRRSFFGLLGAAGLYAGVSGGIMTTMTTMATQARAAGTELNFEGWGGVVSEALRANAFNPYEAATGNKVIDATFGGEAEVLTKVKAAGNTDGHNILHSSGVSWYKRWTDAGYGSELNEANIPNIKNVMTAIIDPFRAITPNNLSAVPYDYGTTGIAYNTKFVSEAKAKELGANLLLDKDLKGKIGGWGGDWANRAWYGALQSNQNPNDIKDWDAVWEKAREHRELVLKYWSSGAELMDLLAKEEIYVTEAWSGRVAALQAQGHPIAYMDPPNGNAWMESMFVLKGSPMAEAEELLNFMLEPATAIAVAEGQKYPSSLDPNKVKMTAIIEGLPAYDPTGKLDKLIFSNPIFWNSVEKEQTKKWNRVSKGG